MEPTATKVVPMARAQLEHALCALPPEERFMAAKLMIEEAIELALEIEYTTRHSGKRKAIELRAPERHQVANFAR